MGGGAEVAVPEGFGLDVFVADGAEELAGVGVGGGWVVYPARSALLAEEGADIGHVGRDALGRIGDGR